MIDFVLEYFEKELLKNLFEFAPELIVWTLSIAIYSFLVYKFYKFVAKRDVFGFNPFKEKFQNKGLGNKILRKLIGMIKYGLFFPIIVFIWFGAFSLMLFVLAKELTTAQILIVAISFITAIRLVSYYTEDLSKDMAKLIPFAILGIIIIDPSFFIIDLAIQRIQEIPEFLPHLLTYFVFVLLVEWVLRILLSIKHAIFGIKIEKPQE